MVNFFIFTEAYNCSDILKNCLKSFYKYHDDVVHIFCTEEDLDNLKEFDKIKPILIFKNSYIDLAYKFGHLGTARIFSEAILNSNCNNIIHFDSDLIFKTKCLDKIKEKLNEGYDLVGPCRPYKNNANNRDDIRDLPDVIATCFMGFKKDKLITTNIDDLTYRINGLAYKNREVLDFFDNISLQILDKNGKAYYFDYDFTGGSNHKGSRKNKYGDLNKEIDVGDWYVHFAGIGSGSKIFKKGLERVHSGYGNWALERYFLYKKIIENVSLNDNIVNDEKCNYYKKYLKLENTNE